ncbi:MAG: bifunctional DNA-formamidopyrimidine glycosylase/DNA-(apurinic or apyrimidinic site) lyase [Steroidobacteraceae bacterium]|jgi:formamidopyrimidine-DNA glycosylase|nr:bifunctional DNA-formamidopyrimidine glycosylase/DNA-(apurinic or apyrimidinic site) lyase [Steroidobacteraceae bacterium]
MPELPEVETTRRGIAPVLEGSTIAAVCVRERRLRWALAPDFERSLEGRRVLAVARRAKYLLVHTDGGVLIAHLGMSGSLRVLPAGTPPLTHDHVDLVLDSGPCIRFNDPRRFGSLHFVPAGADPDAHPLLAKLGPEPLSSAFDGAHLRARSRDRRVAVKQFLMDSHVVVGVGNIYASEALFRARVRPGRAAGRLTAAECERIAAAVKTVLAEAIEVGGTTLRDYVNADGLPGYFRQRLYVYERAGEPCRECGKPIRHRVQGQRSTYWCATCQA